MMTKPFPSHCAAAGVVAAMGLCALLLLGGCGERSASAEAAQADAESIPKPTIVDTGGVVEVKATKEGLTRVGAAKCKSCHVVQFDSWSAGAHAKRTPPLDCESCHGAGSEYKALAVMKDPVKALAAGLVMPDREFCAKCHRSGWTDDMLARAHAHKAAVGAK